MSEARKWTAKEREREREGEMKVVGNQHIARKREPRENMSWYFGFVTQTQTPETSRTTSPMQAASASLRAAAQPGKMVLQQDSRVWNATMIFAS